MSDSLPIGAELVPPRRRRERKVVRSTGDEGNRAAEEAKAMHGRRSDMIDFKTERAEAQRQARRQRRNCD